MSLSELQTIHPRQHTYTCTRLRILSTLSTTAASAKLIIGAALTFPEAGCWSSSRMPSGACVSVEIGDDAQGEQPSPFFVRVEKTYRSRLRACLFLQSYAQGFRSPVSSIGDSLTQYVWGVPSSIYNDRRLCVALSPLAWRFLKAWIWGPWMDATRSCCC